MFDLKDKVIIVTGSNRGNGLAISNGLKNARAKVIGIDLKSGKDVIEELHEFKDGTFLEKYSKFKVIPKIKLLNN